MTDITTKLPWLTSSTRIVLILVTIAFSFVVIFALITNNPNFKEIFAAWVLFVSNVASYFFGQRTGELKGFTKVDESLPTEGQV